MSHSTLIKNTNIFYTLVGIDTWREIAPGAWTPETKLPRMTANESSSAESENSVSQSARDGIQPSAHDPELVQIARCAYDTAGATTRQDLAVETGLLLTEIDELLQQLEAEGYADLIGESDRQVVLLTSRGEWLAQEGKR